MSVRGGAAVVVDPFGTTALRELAELTGLQVRTSRVWPFDLGPRDRVVSTVPVPRARSGDVLGVVVGTFTPPGIGEAWPDRTVTLEEGAAGIVAHLAGDSDPSGMVVAVTGTRGGIGTTTFGAALARILAEEPLAVAFVDTDPVPRARALLELTEGISWADLAGETGPFLPHRIDASLPVWERVRVLASDHRGMAGLRPGAAVHALACALDVVVVDSGRDLDMAREFQPTLFVPVLAGDLADIEFVGRLRMSLDSSCAVVPVVRAGGAMRPEEAALRLGVEVVALGIERNGAAAAAHGSRPGERPRGAVAQAARAVARICLKQL